MLSWSVQCPTGLGAATGSSAMAASATWCGAGALVGTGGEANGFAAGAGTGDAACGAAGAGIAGAAGSSSKSRSWKSPGALASSIARSSRRVSVRSGVVASNGDGAAAGAGSGRCRCGRGRLLALRRKGVRAARRAAASRPLRRTATTGRIRRRGAGRCSRAAAPEALPGAGCGAAGACAGGAG